MKMEKKVFQFGETHPVIILSSDKNLIACHATDINEGFFLVGHGMRDLPKKDEQGIITFTKGGPTGGYWKYSLNPQTPAP